MRNGVLGVFGEIISKVLSNENIDENMKKTRESLLTTLEVWMIICKIFLVFLIKDCMHT